MLKLKNRKKEELFLQIGPHSGITELDHYKSMCHPGNHSFVF